MKKKELEIWNKLNLDVQYYDKVNPELSKYIHSLMHWMGMKCPYKDCTTLKRVTR